jgi:tol-pal system protein YbgF
MTILRGLRGLALLLAVGAVQAAEPAPPSAPVVAAAPAPGPAAAPAARLQPPAAAAPAKPAVATDNLAARLERLEEQSKSGGLFSLLNQVETLKAEVARLRGEQEEMTHRQQMADKRQKEVLADYDARIKELREQLASRPAPAHAAAGAARPAEVAVPAQSAQAVPPPADPEAETKAYEAALNHFKSAEYAASAGAFNAFLAKYPNSQLAGNACYWLGLTHFSMGDHKGAVAAQQRLIKDYPQHAKVPDAMVNLARAQIQLGETETARQGLEQVIAKYPNTKSADLAKKILSLFK